MAKTTSTLEYAKIYDLVFAELSLEAQAELTAMVNALVSSIHYGLGESSAKEFIVKWAIFPQRKHIMEAQRNETHPH